MPRNPGFNPYANQKDAPMVDLKYRNGWIARSVDPGKRRWVPEVMAIDAEEYLRRERERRRAMK